MGVCSFGGIPKHKSQFPMFSHGFLQGDCTIIGSESLGTPWNTPEHRGFCFRNPPDMLCLEVAHCCNIHEILMFYNGYSLSNKAASALSLDMRVGRLESVATVGGGSRGQRVVP